ncbi:hypothetical protein, partial [Escherichia coli]|uniref:hypothetical protein n=1 Tax=Escherichia coli TaxID=562 RepID=UPI001961072B
LSTYVLIFWGLKGELAGDIIYRASLSNLMIQSNKETCIFFDSLDGFNYSYIPYHYIVLWLNGAVSYLFTDGDPLKSWLFIVLPAFTNLSVSLFY